MCELCLAQWSAAFLLLLLFPRVLFLLLLLRSQEPRRYDGRESNAGFSLTGVEFLLGIKQIGEVK